MINIVQPVSRDGSFKPLILPFGSRAEIGQQLYFAGKSISRYERCDRSMLDARGFGPRFDRHRKQCERWKLRLTKLQIRIIERMLKASETK